MSLIIILFIVMLVIFSILWGNRTFSVKTLNQMIYLLIVMWVFSAVPEKMIMVYAMVFGAHLFPYSWLYKSKGYTVVAISIPVISLILGCTLNGTTVAAAACIIEVVFACVLHMELKKMADN